MLFYLQCLFAQTEESEERMINIMSKNIFMLVRGGEFITGRGGAVTSALSWCPSLSLGRNFCVLCRIMKKKNSVCDF